MTLASFIMLTVIGSIILNVIVMGLSATLSVFPTLPRLGPAFVERVLSRRNHPFAVGKARVAHAAQPL